MQKQVTKRTVITVEDKRIAFMALQSRKGRDAQIPAEAFVRNLLKDRCGWARREPSPDAIKQFAKKMAELSGPVPKQAAVIGA